MSQALPYSCCLIGSDTLLMQCGDAWLGNGHSIAQVVTHSRDVERWAREHGIPVLDAESDYTSRLQSIEFDYLFSIAHLAIIPIPAIAAARSAAINFHDGPLPEYAGLNTPMWALLNGAKEHAVSWHIMSPDVDAGGVLLRAPIEVADDETAVSLNTKCFTAALDSFEDLVRQMERGELNPQAQDLTKRRYFGRTARHDHFSLIDWEQTAEDAARLVRALNTGIYENQLGSAKVIHRDRVYIVDHAKSADVDHNATPGEILSASADGILVACGRGALELKHLKDLDGREVPVEALDASAGEVLCPAHEYAGQESDAAAIAQQETHWAHDLSLLEPPAVPGRAPSVATESGSSHTRTIKVPDEIANLGGDYIAAGFLAYLSRMSGASPISIAISDAPQREIAQRVAPLVEDYVWLTTTVNQFRPIAAETNALAAKVDDCRQTVPWLKDLVARVPALRSSEWLGESSPLPALITFGDERPTSGAELVLQIADEVTLELTADAYETESADRLASLFEKWLASWAASSETSGSDFDLLDAAERQFLLGDLNQTAIEYDASLFMHSGFEALAKSQPDATAVVTSTDSITYGELDKRANGLAMELHAAGAGPDTLVGVYVSRCVDLLVATLGVLKAGAAYVPLDPAFPKDRIALMVEDSRMPIIVTQARIAAALPPSAAKTIEIEQCPSTDQPPASAAGSSSANLAYVIYTSGSTGKPKGVMIEHRNVVNFYVAMDRSVPGADAEGRTWLAVTSLSFDISVLELFWTLNRGFKVVLYDEASVRSGGQDAANVPRRVLDFGLFMWGNDDAPGPDKYRLLTEGAKFFDKNGFAAVWTPERHFHAFGGPYPNPAVTGAAIATITSNVKIRAGSCVVPLHHPLRIAEEWAVVDNLSNGRVEIAAASGWNPNDFVLKPENHADNKTVMYEQLEQVRRLWRGEKLPFSGPLGEVEVGSLPRPVQAELPCWITTAGNPETWIGAAKLGLNVLTHLLGQSVEEVAEKVQLYRDARAQAGHDPDGGRVALMLHTLVGEDKARIKELVREPMKEYLSSSMKLAMDYAWSFPVFKRPGGDVTKPEDVDLKSLSAEEVDTILNFAFERYFDTSGLFGDEGSCLTMLARCADAGIDEIACLMDFGVETQVVMDSLPTLKSLHDRMTALASEQEQPAAITALPDLVVEHAVTHLQCTPSTARMYLTSDETRDIMAKVPHLLLGGEALPPALATEIKDLNGGTLTNMYGPTETTIWSLTSAVDDPGRGISIGYPIANTRIYVLDPLKQPVPRGMPGELYIGGDGVSRGYLNQPELTTERFLDDPFNDAALSRMYATGDLVTVQADGRVEYLGRSDFQVKVRGYRIELGEIESALEAADAVQEAAVIVRSPGADDQRLVAYVTPAQGGRVDTAELRNALRQSLPEYMVPNELIAIDEMPRTANGKLDRKALEKVKPAAARQIDSSAEPQSDIEKTVAEAWRDVLKLDQVGLNENFFDLGGHSLLVVQLHKTIKERVDRPVSLTDLYQYTTIKTFADFLAGGADNRTIEQGVSRGEKRRAMRRRRAS